MAQTLDTSQQKENKKEVHAPPPIKRTPADSTTTKLQVRQNVFTKKQAQRIDDLYKKPETMQMEIDTTTNIRIHTKLTDQIEKEIYHKKYPDPLMMKRKQ